MFKFFGRLLGFVEKEYHEIVGAFQKAEADLVALAQRKRDEAQDHFDNATVSRMNGEAKTLQADQAEATAKNIRTLLAA